MVAGRGRLDCFEVGRCLKMGRVSFFVCYGAGEYCAVLGVAVVEITVMPMRWFPGAGRGRMRAGVRVGGGRVGA